jgi:Domain of unknown function (DUF4129)
MRGSARALVPALVVLGLVGVVAVAATGTTSTGTNESRAPADWILDSFLSLFIVLLIPAAALLVFGLTQRQAIRAEMASGRSKRRSMFTYLAFMALFAGVTYYRVRDWERTPTEAEVSDAFSDGKTTVTQPPPGAGSSYEPEFTWIPLLVIGSLVVVGVAIAMLVARRRTPLSQDEIIARELAGALDDSLDALRAEPDARRAVIAAYARLERVLAAHRLERIESETPNEYLTRILEDLDVEPRSVRRLTDLFTEAKFSHHTVDAAMKEEAIEALTTVRDELRARREAQHAAPSSTPPLEAGASP